MPYTNKAAASLDDLIVKARTAFPSMLPSAERYQLMQAIGVMEEEKRGGIYAGLHLETAACLWEAVLDMEQIGQGAQDSGDNGSPEERGAAIRACRDAIGSSALRFTVIGWTDAVDEAWRIADSVDTGGGAFDWEFVPDWIVANIDWSDPNNPCIRPTAAHAAVSPSVEPQAIQPDASAPANHLLRDALDFLEGLGRQQLLTGVPERRLLARLRAAVLDVPALPDDLHKVIIDRHEFAVDRDAHGFVGFRRECGSGWTVFVSSNTAGNIPTQRDWVVRVARTDTTELALEMVSSEPHDTQVPLERAVAAAIAFGGGDV